MVQRRCKLIKRFIIIIVIIGLSCEDCRGSGLCESERVTTVVTLPFSLCQLKTEVKPRSSECIGLCQLKVPDSFRLGFIDIVLILTGMCDGSLCVLGTPFALLHSFPAPKQLLCCCLLRVTSPQLLDPGIAGASVGSFNLIMRVCLCACIGVRLCAHKSIVIYNSPHPSPTTLYTHTYCLFNIA